jgi:hypothetical protein
MVSQSEAWCVAKTAGPGRKRTRSCHQYFRNPMGFIHAPFSNEGCVILVKLHQFQPDDTRRIAIQTDHAGWHQLAAGIEFQLLHEHNEEKVVLLKMSNLAGPLRLDDPRGEEVFIISGNLCENAGSYHAGSWLRFPGGSNHCLYATEDTLVWKKSGHLWPL